MVMTMDRGREHVVVGAASVGARGGGVSTAGRPLFYEIVAVRLSLPRRGSPPTRRASVPRAWKVVFSVIIREKEKSWTGYRLTAAARRRDERPGTKQLCNAG